MLAVGGMTSCSDILDKEVDLTYTDENIYSNYDRTRGVLANAYTYLPDAFAGYSDGQFRAASRDCMTDNALSYWNVHYYHSVLNDSYDAKNHWFANSYWSNDLKGIRVCNDFISKARESVIGNALRPLQGRGAFHPCHPSFRYDWLFRCSAYRGSCVG